MITRAGEVGWIRSHLDDLEADFARFFRVDYLSLDGPRFVTRAERVSAYGGVMTARIQELYRDAEPELEPEDDFPPVPAGARAVPVSELADMIEG